MSRIRPLIAASAIAIAAAGPAAAELSAAEIWQSFQGYADTYGMTLEVGSQEEAGGTLTARDVVMRMPPAPAVAGGAASDTASVTIPAIAFAENADGTVSVSVPEPLTLAIGFEDPEAGPVSMAFEIAQPGLDVTVREVEGGIGYDYAAPSMTMTATEVLEAGAPVPLDLRLALTDMRGSYVTTGEAPATNEQDFSAAAMTLDLDFSDEEGTAIVAVALDGLTGTSTTVLPEGVDLADMNAAVRGGFSTDGTLDFATSSYTFDVTDETGPTMIAGGSEGGGGLSFAMGEDGFGYGTRAARSSISVSSAAMPVPQVSATIARTGFDLLFPVIAAPESAPYRLAIRLEELVVDEALWGMMDPAGALDRSPWSLVLDLAGRATLDLDIMDPAAAAAADPMAAPGTVESLDVAALRLSVLGADLSGEGAFTFDADDQTTFPGMPAPTGSLALTLSGAEALMDQLVAMGFVPEDQVMMGRMMLGMFATPAGADVYESTIEIRDGGIFANGTQIQ